MSDTTKAANGFTRAYKVLGLIATSIVIITSIYYVIIDRLDVIAQVKDNTRRVTTIEKQIENMEEGKKQLNDIQYNLKRLLEKQGLVWEKFGD